MSTDLPKPLEAFASYLDLFARTRMPPGLRHRFDVSDVVQQSLLEAHAGRDRFRGGTSGELAVWLRRIVARNLADAMRAQQRQKRDPGREKGGDAELQASSVRLERWLAAEQSSPSHALQRVEAAMSVADGLAQLPEAQREALICRFWQGMKVREIATAMGRSTAAVAGLLQRGATTLAEVLPR